MAGGESARGGVPIDVIPLTYEVKHEVVLESLDVPLRVAARSTVTVRVVLHATSRATGVLRLVREGEELDINGDRPGLGRRLRLEPGRRVELIQVELGPGKIHRFEAVFEPDTIKDGESGAGTYAGDTDLDNNRASALTITPGQGTVLLVDGTGFDSGGSAKESVLARTLREAGIDVTVTPPEGMPGGLVELQAYDLVMLVNVPAESLPRSVHEHLVTYVRDLGGGLVMVGGPDSFGAGGWIGTSVADILPVLLDLPEKLVMPAAAIVLVLDNSGSMGRSVYGSARSQQQIANEAAALAVTTLDKTDMVGVITFNSTHAVLVPLGENTDPDATAGRIRSIASGGGTRLVPALAEARRQLESVDAKVKHVIVLSDGQSQDASLLAPMAEAMHGAGISVTTIGVGDSMDEQTLSEMARVGGGVYHAVVNPNVLPRVFLRAVRVVRTPMLRLTPFVPVVLPTGSPLVEGLGKTIPELGGLVLTRAREDPTVTHAMATPTGEPVLAHWNVGLGRVAAFTSDASDWAGAWLDWGGYRLMWTRIARVIARPTGASAGELTTELVGDTLRLRLDAADKDGSPMDLLTVPATVYSPSGEHRDVMLDQTGPGVYEAKVPVRESGNHVVIVTPRLGGKRLTPVVGGASLATGVEYRRLSSNPALLEQISSETGGRVLDINEPGRADLFARVGTEPSLARTPIWRSLLLWTLLVLLLDIGTRRVAWDRFVSREFGVELRKAAAESVRDRSEQSSRALSLLRRRGRKSGDEPSRAFTEQDAVELARQEARRRRREELEKYAELRQRLTEERAGSDSETPVSLDDQPGPAASQGGAAASSHRGSGDHADDRPTSSLLDAKRRARARYERRGERGERGDGGDGGEGGEGSEDTEGS